MVVEEVEARGERRLNAAGRPNCESTTYSLPQAHLLSSDFSKFLDSTCFTTSYDVQANPLIPLEARGCPTRLLRS